MRIKNLLLPLFALLVCSTLVNSQSIVVNGSVPGAGTQTGSCFYNNSFVLTVNNLSNTATYAWDFGDNSTSSFATPTHGYTAAGTYKVHVSAVDAGVTYSLDQAINVYPSPVASFNSLAGTVNGNSYTFLSTSVVSSGIISSYLWSFGDGSGDVISNPTKTYGAAGNYNVKLIVASEQGCIDSTAQSVNITLTGSTIASSFTIDNASQCSLGNSFNFTNTGTFDASLSYSWNFGDGTSANTFSASHNYSNAGNYNVVLTISNGSNVGTSVNTVAVLSNPVAGFAYACNGKTANFTSTSTGSVTSFAWDFGDATTSNTTNPVIAHTYITPQTLSVQLVALSTGGCTDTTHQSITIVDNPNAASFTVDAPMCISNNNYHFTNTSVTNGTGVTYAWDFGDGVTDNTSSPAHSFTTAGMHTVTFTVTSSVGTSIATGTVTAYPKPTVSFTINNNDANYTYTNTSSVASGYVANNSWSSTNGNTSSSVNFYETVAASTYTVKLIETSDNGCVDSLSQSVTYTPTAVIASLTASFNVTGTASGICYDNANSYIFNNTSSAGAGVAYTWDFGDGTTDNSTSPTHHYANSGDFTIKLEVDSAGLSATTIQSINLYPIPTPVYILYLNTNLTDVTSQHICFTPGMDFSYISNSKIDKGVMNYSWDFATNGKTFRDGDSAYINPRMLFNQAGTYPVKLLVTSDKGCKDSVTHVVYLSQPVSSFTTTVDYSGDSTNNPLVTFTSTSHDPGGIIINNDWFYENDGSGYQESNGAATTLSTHFTKGGSYNDKLLVTSDAGCVVSSGDVNLAFYIKPTAAFTADTTYNNLGQPVASTTNTSSVNETPQTLSYTWSFGDGSISLATHPSHTYTTGAASRTISLVVTNTNGGKVSSATNILNGMYIKPFAQLTATATNGVLSFDASGSTLHDLGGSLTYSFDFGDTSTGTIVSGTHTYASGAATRVIKVIVTNTNGGLQDSAFVTLSNVFITPIAQFTTSISDLSVTYDGSTSYVNDLGGLLTYSWTFGDGGTSTSASGTYIYNAEGTYTITLTVTNQNGNVVSASVQKIVSVVAPTPVANITAFYTDNMDGTFTYKLAGDNVSNPSTISSGSIVSYNWAWDLVSSIGDTTAGIGSSGSVLTSDPINNAYSLVAILTVTSDKGKMASDTAVFDPTNHVFKGYTYALFGSHSNGNNHITAPTAKTTAVSIANIYPNPANNDITLKVFCTKSGNMNVKIYTIEGKLIKQQTISGAVVNTTLTTHIDISSLAKGTYLTEVTNADGKVVAISKLLKAK